MPVPVTAILLCLWVVAPGSCLADATPTSEDSTSTLIRTQPSGNDLPIQLEALPGKSGEYEGHLTVVVENTAESSGELTVEYIQSGGGRFDALAETPQSPVAPASPVPEGGLVAPPKRPVALQLVFTLPQGRSASWLSGNLLIEVSGASAARQSLLAPVKADFQPLDGIAFQPTPLTVQVTSGNLEGGSTVHLSGPGAESLLDRQPPFASSVLLGNDEGNRTTLALEDFRRGERGDVVATIAVAAPEPGEYKGSLVLGAGAGAASLPVVLHSRRALWLAVVLVLLSSILGGFLPIFTAAARSRALMRTKLKSAIERLEEKYDSELNKPQLLWDMTLAMGPRPWLGRRWSGVSQADGVAGLYADLRLAHSDEDLEDLAPKVDAAIDEIARWLRVFGPSERLQQLSRRDVPSRDDLDWSKTKLASDTEAMLDELKRNRPVSTEQADAMANNCIEQFLWHSLVLDVWMKVTRAQKDQSLSEVQRAKLEAIDFGPIVNADPPPSKRNPAEMTELTRQLAELIRRATRQAPNLDHYADADQETLGKFLSEVDATAGGAQPYSGLEQEAALIQDKARDLARFDPTGTAAERAMQRIRMVDWGVTGVLATGAAVAYTAPLYDSTWGTQANLLAAIAAGFGAQVVVQWGAMPVFRSIRSKKAGDSQLGAPAPPPSAPAGPVAAIPVPAPVPASVPPVPAPDPPAPAPLQPTGDGAPPS